MTMKNHLTLSASIRVHLQFVFLLGFAVMAWGQGSPSDEPTHRFDPKQIQISLNPDLDIVYHTLAHFAVPEDPSNLYSKDYVEHIHQAKKDLEVGQTKLDQFQAA